MLLLLQWQRRRQSFFFLVCLCIAIHAWALYSQAPVCVSVALCVCGGVCMCVWQSSELREFCSVYSPLISTDWSSETIALLWLSCSAVICLSLSLPLLLLPLHSFALITCNKREKCQLEFMICFSLEVLAKLKTFQMQC